MLYLNNRFGLTVAACADSKTQVAIGFIELAKEVFSKYPLVMKKENPKKVAIEEVRKIKEHAADLYEALIMFAEQEASNLARDSAKHIKKLAAAAKSTLTSLGNVKVKKTKSKASVRRRKK
jgi:hypothetical protein